MKCADCIWYYNHGCRTIPTDLYIEDPDEEFDKCDYFTPKEELK